MMRLLRFRRRPQPVLALVNPQTCETGLIRSETSSINRIQATYDLPGMERRSQSVG